MFNYNNIQGEGGAVYSVSQNAFVVRFRGLLFSYSLFSSSFFQSPTRVRFPIRSLIFHVFHLFHSSLLFSFFPFFPFHIIGPSILSSPFSRTRLSFSLQSLRCYSRYHSLSLFLSYSLSLSFLARAPILKNFLHAWRLRRYRSKKSKSSIAETFQELSKFPSFDLSRKKKKEKRKMISYRSRALRFRLRFDLSRSLARDNPSHPYVSSSSSSSFFVSLYLQKKKTRQQRPRVSCRVSGLSSTEFESNETRPPIKIAPDPWFFPPSLLLERKNESNDYSTLQETWIAKGYAILKRENGR